MGDEIKKINTNNFKIENNIISFSNSLIQVSNISQVSIAPIPKKRFNFLSVLALVIGVLLVQTYSESQQYIGTICISGSIAYMLYYIYINTTEEKYLQIFLNSGNIYYIVCRDTQFLDRVLQVIEYCINNHYSQTVTIDFNNCRVLNSPITVGNSNKVS